MRDVQKSHLKFNQSINQSIHATVSIDDRNRRRSTDKRLKIRKNKNYQNEPIHHGNP